MTRRIALALVPLALVALGTACDTEGQRARDERAIRECIARGGVPSFASDKYGLAEYFGCTERP